MSMRLNGLGCYKWAGLSYSDSLEGQWQKYSMHFRFGTIIELRYVAIYLYNYGRLAEPI